MKARSSNNCSAKAELRRRHSINDENWIDAIAMSPPSRKKKKKKSLKEKKSYLATRPIISPPSRKKSTKDVKCSHKRVGLGSRRKTVCSVAVNQIVITRYFFSRATSLLPLKRFPTSTNFLITLLSTHQPTLTLRSSHSHSPLFFLNQNHTLHALWIPSHPRKAGLSKPLPSSLAPPCSCILPSVVPTPSPAALMACKWKRTSIFFFFFFFHGGISCL